MTKGLTLIEVLFVVFLMGIFFASAVFFIPRYRSYATFAIELNKLTDNLRYAREMSIVEQENHAVRFNYDNNQYEIVRYTEKGEDILFKEIFTDEIKIKNIDNFYEVKFTLFGGVFKTGKIKLESSNYERIIHIKPSGFIKVEGSVSN